MPLPTTTIDLPRLKGIILDVYPKNRMCFAVIPTEMGFISVKVLTNKGRTKLSLRDNRGRTEFDSITGGWWWTFDEAVAATRASARKRGSDAIVWLLTEPEPEPQPQEVAP